MLRTACLFALLIPLTGCCRSSNGDAPQPSSSAASKQDTDSGKLAGVTSDSMTSSAQAQGFKVREAVTEREEMPGATIYRLTLDHKSKGTAFVDLYDLSRVSAHVTKPAVKVGRNKALYVSAFGGLSADALLSTLESKTPLARTTRSSVEGYFRSEGWELGDSAKFKDDISGQSIVDVSAHKGGNDVMVILLDYTRVAAGKEQSAMLRDGNRLLFVDTEKRRWSKSLLKKLVK